VFEERFRSKIAEVLDGYQEVVVDISVMSIRLILDTFPGRSIRALRSLQTARRASIRGKPSAVLCAFAAKHRAASRPTRLCGNSIREHPPREARQAAGCAEADGPAVRPYRCWCGVRRLRSSPKARSSGSTFRLVLKCALDVVRN
jgi:hypothetical protein